MNKHINLITRAFLLCLFFGLSTITVFTQNIEHICQVGVLEENLETGEEKGKDLGEFNTSFASKAPLSPLIKTFQIPKTNLFISVSVNYSAKPSNLKLFPLDEMFLGLILGKRPFKNGLDELSNNKSARKDVLSIAMAEFPLKSFEKSGTGRIATVFIGKKKITSVILECKE